jgi:hypothetical protein
MERFSYETDACFFPWGKCPRGWQTRIVDDSRTPRQRHPADQLAPWVFLQHQVWVDRGGPSMRSSPCPWTTSRPSFCHGQAYRILMIVTIELWSRRWHLRVPMTDIPDPLDWSPSDEDASGWLERTPVMIALRRREDRLNTR